jgi:hypothetical protein
VVHVLNLPACHDGAMSKISILYWPRSPDRG